MRCRSDLQEQKKNSKGAALREMQVLKHVTHKIKQNGNKSHSLKHKKSLKSMMDLGTYRM